MRERAYSGQTWDCVDLFEATGSATVASEHQYERFAIPIHLVRFRVLLSYTLCKVSVLLARRVMTKRGPIVRIEIGAMLRFEGECVGIDPSKELDDCLHDVAIPECRGRATDFASEAEDWDDGFLEDTTTCFAYAAIGPGLERFLGQRKTEQSGARVCQAAVKRLDWDVLLVQLAERPETAVCDFGLEEEVHHVVFTIEVKVCIRTT